MIRRDMGRAFFQVKPWGSPIPARSAIRLAPDFGADLQRFEIPPAVELESYVNPNRIPNDIYSLIQNESKVILHDHLRGSVDTSLVRKDIIAKASQGHPPACEGLPLPVDAFAWGPWEHLKNYFRFKMDPGQPTSLSQYRESRKKLSELVPKNPSTLYQTSYLYGLKSAMHGVRYVEVRYAPGSYPPGNAFRAMVRGFEDARRQLQKAGKALDYGIILSLYRHGDERLVKGPDGKPLMKKVLVGMEQAQLAVDLRKAGYPVVGLDLASDEAHNPLSAFQPAFDIIHAHNDAMVREGRPELRIGITLHSGETERSEGSGPGVRDGKPVPEAYSGAETIQKAIEVGWRPNTPLRIGHGLELFNGSPELLALVKAKNVAFELNPKCNNQTRQIYYDEHPVTAFLKHGIPISINPDNQTVTNTDPTNESVKLLKAGISTPERRAIALQAIDHSFIFDEQKKAAIKADIQRLFDKTDTQISSLLAQDRERTYIQALSRQETPSFSKTPYPPEPTQDDIVNASVQAGKNGLNYYLKKWHGHQG